MLSMIDPCQCVGACGAHQHCGQLRHRPLEQDEPYCYFCGFMIARYEDMVEADRLGLRAAPVPVARGQLSLFGGCNA